jgi:hypothetical protein
MGFQIFLTFILIIPGLLERVAINTNGLILVPTIHMLRSVNTQYLHSNKSFVMTQRETQLLRARFGEFVAVFLLGKKTLLYTIYVFLYINAKFGNRQFAKFTRARSP